jgi:two-component system, NtrC family, sensor kinase
MAQDPKRVADRGSGTSRFLRRGGAGAPRSLGGRLVLALTGALVILLGVSGFLALELHRKHLYGLLEQNALDLGETILSSTHFSMLENDRRHLEEILGSIGRRESVLALRLIDARGQVRFSKHPEEIGRSSNLSAPVCAGCHTGSAIRAPTSLRDGLHLYASPDGRRALGLGVPVLNSSECADAACHVHPPDQRVLGMLDIELSTVALEDNMRSARWQFTALALFTMIGSAGVMGFLAWRIVHRPLHRVLLGIRRLGAGDLTLRLPETEVGEVAELSAAFNDMSARLGTAQHELEDWAATLETKVAEKTRELERTRDQMVFTEKMASLGKLAAVVAHEINNPLAGILVYAKLLRRRLPKLRENGNSLSEMDANLATIETETARCGDIVRNLLLFSRRSETRREPADLRAVLERALRLLQHQADLARVTIQLELEEIPNVICDPAEIQQAFLAVLMNALEAMPDGGTLTVRARFQAALDTVTIEIQDTGPGIPPEIRPRIFEPFFSTKSEGKGTGLGLAVTYGIVRRHAGHIEYDSEVGRGTVFRIVLPVRAAEAAERAAEVGGKETAS